MIEKDLQHIYTTEKMELKSVLENKNRAELK